MDKRLNPRNVYKKEIKDKTIEGVELVKRRKRDKTKGSVTFHINRDGVVADIENREFF